MKKLLPIVLGTVLGLTAISAVAFDYQAPTDKKEDKDKKDDKKDDKKEDKKDEKKKP